MQTSTQKMLKACREMLIPRRTNKRQMLCDAGITLGILLLASVVCALLTHVGDSDSAVPMVFVLAVLLIARLTNGFLFFWRRLCRSSGSIMRLPIRILNSISR